MQSMRNFSILALALASLVACTSMRPATQLAPEDQCSPATLGQYAGQPATAELGAAMLRANGKTAIRWVQPGMAVTMDFREDRLTVYVDAKGRVERASCS